MAKPKRLKPNRPVLIYEPVPRLWPGSTVVCLGTGPSLTAEDVDACRDRVRVIAVNDAHRLAPWADVLYACDAKFWRHYEGVKSFTGLRYALDTAAKPWGVTVLKRTGRDGLELDPTGLKTGMNSGYQAINLAVHLGARRILLLGYDMSLKAGRPSHFFGEHPQKLQASSPFVSFRQCFQTMVAPLKAAGVEVVNCSRETALSCFPKQSLEQALPARMEMAS